MSKLGDALGFGTKGEETAPSSIPEDVEAMDAKAERPAGGSAEVLAMKQFERATSTEAKVAALKDFLEACGAIGTDDAAY